MKNLFKIFLAVAALFAYACATDTTEDLGVNLGGETTITLSLEESRTQLGEKAEGVYPLFWSEGDAISINGVASNGLTAQQAGSSVATFTVQGTLATPYCIAYPAAPAGQVIFAENQTHVGNGTFGNGVSTMFAYGTEAGVALHHLTGVLKFGITGAEKLSLVQVSTVDRAPIAGAFNFDFATGEATATEASKATISYSFGEGVQLSAEPTYVHVAVPAGVYDELYVTLYDANGGVMYATIKADEEKPLAAGKVRVFHNAITYTATDKVHIVKDVASLKAFAAEAATATKDVLFVADVDMTGEAWTPIEGYTGTVLGNGYAINGLTAPLFGTTSASFKGLHLTNVNINETELPTVGALARKIVTAVTGNYPTVEHCSVSGSIVVNCENYEVTVNDHGTLVTGGLVGYTSGVTFSDCVNHASIDVKQYAKMGNTQATTALIGGVLGCSGAYVREDSTYQASSLLNCENTGDIKLGDKSYTGEHSVEGNGTFPKIAVWIGGVLGGDLANSTEGFETNLVNRGNITIDAYTEGAFVGGVIGHSYAATRDGLKNYGKITIENLISTRLLLGGIVSCIQSNTLSNSHNYGAIEVKNGWGRELYLGGVIGMNKSIINDCENSGSITSNFEIGTRSAAYGSVKRLAIGGVAGELSSSANEMNNCKNNATGDIVATGNFFNGNAKLGYHGIGGVAGVMVGKVTNSVNDGDITVNATTTYAEASTDADGKAVEGNQATAALHIGGALGTCLTDNYNTNTAQNNGKVSVVGGTYGGPLHIAGLCGYASRRFGGLGAEHIINTGDVTLGTAAGTAIDLQYNLRIAGATGQTDLHVCDMTNKGNITVHPGVTVARTACIAGIIGKPADAANPIARINNEGDITINGGTFVGRIELGGIVSEFRHQYLVDATNSGNITIKNGTSFSDSNSSCIGGIAGIGAFHATNKTSFKRSVNSGKITIEEGVAFGQSLHIAGNIALVSEALPIVDVANNGEISYNGTCTGRLTLGGIVGDCKGTTATNDVGGTNNGKITIGDKASANEYVIGGTAGLTRSAYRNATNNGDIEVSGKCTSFFRVGGVVGWIASAGTRNLYNNGNITIKGKMVVDAQSQIGGLVGLGQAQVAYGANTGNIKIEKGATLTGQLMLGGIIGDIRTYIQDCNVTGNVIVEDIAAAGNDNYVGGAVGVIGDRSIQNTKVFCNVYAPGQAHVGMICADTMEYTALTNSHCGGSYTKEVEIKENSELELIPTPQTVELSKENYFEHIFNTEVSAEDAKNNLWGYISSIEATPVAADGTELVVTE